MEREIEMAQNIIDDPKRSSANRKIAERALIVAGTGAVLYFFVMVTLALWYFAGLYFIENIFSWSHVEATVRVLLQLDDYIAAAEDDQILVTVFHPELTPSLAFHRYFARKCGLSPLDEDHVPDIDPAWDRNSWTRFAMVPQGGSPRFKKGRTGTTGD